MQPLSAYQSQTIAVKSVGKSHLKSTIHQQDGEQCDQKQVEVCLKQLNSTMIQEGGKHLDAEGTEMCAIQPSSTTVQKSLHSRFKELKVISCIVASCCTRLTFINIK
jgi:molecular chaperone DnaK (HSP70)